MNHTRTVLAPSVLLLFAASAASAQNLEELCPNSDGTGALLGIVSDTDAQMALPGAEVQATWIDDGTPGRAETQTGLDGSFTMCYLPIGLEVSIRAMFGTMAGQAVALTLGEPITRQDVGFSLTGGGATDDGEDKIWACIGPPDSQMRIQLGSLVRCDSQWPSLDRCPKEELGKVSASGGGGGRRGGAMREMVDQLVDKAKGLGANALVDFTGGRGSVEAMAVKIEVDPSTC